MVHVAVRLSYELMLKGRNLRLLLRGDNLCADTFTHTNDVIDNAWETVDVEAPARERHLSLFAKTLCSLC